MPFGLCGAPSSFQRLMDTIMRGLPFVTTCMDDVLIHSSNEEIHRSHLDEVLQQLQEAGLTLCGSKCQAVAVWALIIWGGAPPPPPPQCPHALVGEV